MSEAIGLKNENDNNGTESMTESTLTNYHVQKVKVKMSIATLEEIENLPNNPEILLIDVRDPPEIKSTGLIPTAINIPCKFKFSEIEM